MNFFGKTNPDTLDATHASLSQAVRSGDAAALAQALSGVKPAVVNHVPPEKLPLLFLAVMNNSADCTRLLLGARAEVDLADASGATAAFLAARNDAAPCLELLVGASADLNRARASGATPLYVAAQNDSRRCLGTLLAAGADANLAKEGGFTPLCIGVLRGQKEVVATLLRGRADADQPYTIADRFTPLMIAAHLGHVEIATLLAQSGASLGRRDAAGRTAQQVAAAAKQGLAEAAIVAQSEEVARESTLVAQEAMLQELRQLRPVQSHLEVEAAKLEQLQLQAATFASEEGVFGGASALQEACTTLASDLLPAGRMLTELAQLDADASRMEARRHAPPPPSRPPPARPPPLTTPPRPSPGAPRSGGGGAARTPGGGERRARRPHPRRSTRHCPQGARRGAHGASSAVRTEGEPR